MSYRVSVFFFNDTATPEIYTLSLHDALPICSLRGGSFNTSLLRALGENLPDGIEWRLLPPGLVKALPAFDVDDEQARSEEHNSELQSRPIPRMPAFAL